MAKPVETLELHYPMIQFFNNKYHTVIFLRLLGSHPTIDGPILEKNEVLELGFKTKGET